MYTYTWKKYLPVIRLLLKRSAAADQVITLNRIDFEKSNRTRKPACSFSVEVVRSKLSMMNAPIPAKDLFEILTGDDVAKGLLRQNDYAISLNSDFELTIKKIVAVPATVEGEEVLPADDEPVTTAEV